MGGSDHKLRMNNYDQLKDMFRQNVPEIDLATVFDTPEQFDDFMKKYFGKHIVEEDGLTYLNTKSMGIFFRHQYEAKILICRYLDCGLNFSCRFYDETRDRYLNLFSLFDTSGDGLIDFEELKVFINNLDPKI